MEYKLTIEEEKEEVEEEEENSAGSLDLNFDEED